MVDDATAAGSGALSSAAAAGRGATYMKRSSTEAMLRVLQQEIRRSTAKSHPIEWLNDLVLLEVIGKGGFGVVYRGTWKGATAAVKVRDDS